MNNKIIYGGICAVALGFATAVSVCSCNGDDEYYEGGNYTLARQRMTRSAEPGVPGAPSLTVSYRSGSEDVETALSNCGKLKFKVAWNASSMNLIHVDYKGFEASQNKSYVDCFGDRIDVPECVVNKVEKNGPVVLSNDIISTSFKVYYSKAVLLGKNCGHNVKDKLGCSVYGAGKEMTDIVLVTLDISSYRKPDGYVKNYD